jgi:hypothetical protein
MRTANVVTFLLVSSFLSYSAWATSASELAKFTPEKIGDFSATESATVQDTTKGDGPFHRVQRTYNSKNGPMSVIAIIEGPDVANNIKNVFSGTGRKTSVKKFEVMQTSPSGMVQASVKVGKQCLLTVVVMNTADGSLVIDFIKKLDLDGLAKAVR